MPDLSSGADGLTASQEEQLRKEFNNLCKRGCRTEAGQADRQLRPIQAGSKMIVIKPQSSNAGRVVTVIDANWHGMVKVRAHTRSRMVQP